MTLFKNNKAFLYVHMYRVNTLVFNYIQSGLRYIFLLNHYTESPT